MTEAPKRPPGRPPLGEGEEERLEIRLSKARKTAYSAAAARRGLKLAAWIRTVLDRASKR
jgi:predicted DNA binding CopG/RHH family protein